MAYNATYDSADASSILIDILGTVAVVFVGFASLIGLVFLYRWAKKKVK